MRLFLKQAVAGLALFLMSMPAVRADETKASFNEYLLKSVDKIYNERKRGGYSLGAGAVSEVVMTLFFLLVILGTTAKRAPAGFAGIPIGLALTLIHLVSIPVTNTSVNPARSTGPALFVGGWALSQLWLFWVAPIAGAVVAGVIYRSLFDEK